MNGTLFIEDGIACHIVNPRNRAFSMLYLIVFGFGAKLEEGLKERGLIREGGLIQGK